MQPLASVYQTRLDVEYAVPTAILAPRVQRGSIPGPPGALFLGLVMNGLGYSLRLARQYYRVSTFQPALQASRERSHVRDSLTLECERHPGARSFIRSRAVEHQSLATRQLSSSFFEFLGRQSDRARKHPWLSLVVNRVTKINDEDIGARVHLRLQLLWRNTRPTQRTQESASLRILPSHITRKANHHNYGKQATESGRVSYDILQLITE